MADHSIVQNEREVALSGIVQNEREVALSGNDFHFLSNSPIRGWTKTDGGVFSREADDAGIGEVGQDRHNLVVAHRLPPRVEDRAIGPGTLTKVARMLIAG